MFIQAVAAAVRAVQAVRELVPLAQGFPQVVLAVLGLQDTGSVMVMDTPRRPTQVVAVVQRQRFRGLPRKAAGTLLRALAMVPQIQMVTAEHLMTPLRVLFPIRGAVAVAVVGTSLALTTLIPV
jgi:hypothetical protein